MTYTANRQQRRELARQNAKQSDRLAPVPMEDWPLNKPPMLTEVWRSRDYLVQVFDEQGIERLSVARTQIDTANGRWLDGIAWDDLQRLKHECGRGEFNAVEIYPADKDVVNVANMRHLWVIRAPLPFGWRKP
jgi:hypothetical protein